MPDIVLTKQLIDPTKQLIDPISPINLDRKSIGIALAVIFSLGGIAAIGIGISEYLRKGPFSLNQMDSVVMMASGGLINVIIIAILYCNNKQTQATVAPPASLVGGSGAVSGSPRERSGENASLQSVVTLLPATPLQGAPDAIQPMSNAQNVISDQGAPTSFQLSDNSATSPSVQTVVGDAVPVPSLCIPLATSQSPVAPTIAPLVPEFIARIVGVQNLQLETLHRDFCTSLQNAQSLLDQPRHLNDDQPILLLQACQIFQRENPDLTKWTPTEMGTCAYLLYQLRLLSRKQPLTLPYFFHATGSRDGNQPGTALMSISKGRSIFRTKGVMGYGVYISSYNEAGQTYGNCTFAFSKTFCEDKRVEYCHSWNPKPDSQTYRSLWAVIRTTAYDPNIFIPPEILSYIVVPEEICDEMIRQLATTSFAATPVITKDISDSISKLMDKANRKYNLGKWRWVDCEPALYGLPENVVEDPKYAAGTRARPSVNGDSS